MARREIYRSIYLLVAIIAMVITVFWPYVCSMTGRGLLGVLGVIDERSVLLTVIAVVGTGMLVSCMIAIMISRLMDLEFTEILFLGIMSGLIAGLIAGAYSKLYAWDKLCSVPALVFLFVILMLLIVKRPGLFLQTVQYVLKVYQAGISTVKLLRNPVRLDCYSPESFSKALVFLPLSYVGLTMLFSLWFYAVYLECPNFFRIEGTSDPNLWHFIYFSFVTITTLGYGDISPSRFFPQLLVISEVVFGMVLIVLYLNALLQVLGEIIRRSRQ